MCSQCRAHDNWNACELLLVKKQCSQIWLKQTLIIVSWRFYARKVEKIEAITLAWLTALRDHTQSFSLLICMADCQRHSLTFIRISGTYPLLSSTFVTYICVVFIFVKSIKNKKSTCRAWWPTTLPALLHISFAFCFIRNVISSYSATVKVLYLF